jgi:N-acetylglucosaminyl-diphospho-decaprenol L-rhamnosyltransferase
MAATETTSGSVEIVIVNWNTGPYLRDCLSSVAAARDGVRLTAVTVVDNASTDGSADDLDDFGLPLEVVRNRANVGFAAAVDQGASGGESDYLLLLNPDTRLFPDTLATVTAFMEGEDAERIGVCGVAVVDAAGAPAISSSRFPTLRIVFGKVTGLDRALPGLFPSHHLTEEETRRSRVVDQVIGAFYFVRRDLFIRLGGFDTRYFLYYEEVDFALRASRLGYRSYLLKEARVLHVGSVSAGSARDERLFHSLHSRLIYARRHWPRWQYPLLCALTFGLELPARLVAALVRRSGSDTSAALAAYRRLIRSRSTAPE